MPTLTRRHGRLTWLIVVALAMFRAVPALAERAAMRVVLVDPDPELRRAVTTALAPWKLEVIVDPNPQIDDRSAAARAAALDARFVVWREGDQLVVFDRERGDTLRREGQTGTLDPITAASAALTVKTLMRLPPPETDGGPPPPPAEPGLEVRVQLGSAVRIARGSETEVGVRLGGAAMVRPASDLGLRLGVMGEFGSASAVDHAGFKGEWSDWAVLGAASWTWTRGRFEIEPFLGAGIARSTLDGDEMMVPRRELATVFETRLGIWGRWRYGPWTAALTFEVSALVATPTYTKASSGTVIYQVPSSALGLGGVIAVDLGR